jgi:hypothetical protein
MQAQKIVLIPPTHEQSTPSFHVTDELLEPFMEYLGGHGIHIVGQPPEPLGPMGPQGCELDEIEIEEGTSMPKLETLMNEFLAERHLANVG